MEPTPRLEATQPVTASTTSIDSAGQGNDPLPAVGLIRFSNIKFLGGANSQQGLGNAVLDFLGTLWNVYVVLALLFSLFLLVLYAYASMMRWYYYGQSDDQLREAESLYDAQFRGVAKNSRLDDIQGHIESDNPNDWKLAIIEADIILDGLLKERGYAGNTLGERLRSISPNQLASLQDAECITFVQIAHEGPDFVPWRMASAINHYGALGF